MAFLSPFFVGRIIHAMERFLAMLRLPCRQGRAALHISRNLNGVPGLNRAERRTANPSNLIRIMPAEGA
jgi:hypothetical protein